MRKERDRASVVCQAEGLLLVVRLRDPVTNVEAIYPPGGGIEPDEDPAETARREALEETGLAVRVSKATDDVIVEKYPFTWGADDYAVTTHYFAAELEGVFDANAKLPKVEDATYNLGAAWVPVSEALDQMTRPPEQGGPPDFYWKGVGLPVSKLVRKLNHRRWKQDPNAGGPASTLMMIHDQFRVASDRLRHLLSVESDEDLGWVGRAFQPLGQTLHHHHHAEEAMLFPIVGRLEGKAPARLESDHEELTRAIDAVSAVLKPGGDRSSATAIVDEFHRVLITHLDREEQQVIPLLLQMTAHEAWSLIHG